MTFWDFLHWRPIVETLTPSDDNKAPSGSEAPGFTEATLSLGFLDTVCLAALCYGLLVCGDDETLDFNVSIKDDIPFFLRDVDGYDVSGWVGLFVKDDDGCGFWRLFVLGKGRDGKTKT